MGLLDTFSEAQFQIAGVTMLITMYDSRSPNWSHDCYYIRETDTKYIVWGNKAKTVEFHYPKHTHHYKERENE